MFCIGMLQVSFLNNYYEFHAGDVISLVSRSTSGEVTLQVPCFFFQFGCWIQLSPLLFTFACRMLCSSYVITSSCWANIVVRWNANFKTNFDDINNVVSNNPLYKYLAKSGCNKKWMWKTIVICVLYRPNPKEAIQPWLG